MATLMEVVCLARIILGAAIGMQAEAELQLMQLTKYHQHDEEPPATPAPTAQLGGCVDRDDDVRQVAQSQGLPFTTCSDPIMKMMCSDHEMGAMIRDMCCTTCQAPTACEDHNDEAAVATNSAAMSCADAQQKGMCSAAMVQAVCCAMCNSSPAPTPVAGVCVDRDDDVRQAAHSQGLPFTTCSDPMVKMMCSDHEMGAMIREMCCITCQAPTACEDHNDEVAVATNSAAMSCADAQQKGMCSAAPVQAVCCATCTGSPVPTPVTGVCVDRDDDVSQVAQSQGLPFTKCSDAIVKMMCNDPEMGAMIRDMCCTTCQAPTACEDHNEEVAVATSSAAMSCADAQQKGMCSTAPVQAVCCATCTGSPAPTSTAGGCVDRDDDVRQVAQSQGLPFTTCSDPMVKTMCSDHEMGAMITDMCCVTCKEALPLPPSQEPTPRPTYDGPTCSRLCLITTKTWAEKCGMIACSACPECQTPDPTPDPTASPTLWPTLDPTASPTLWPTLDPTASPTLYPTAFPTPSPTPAPTYVHCDRPDGTGLSSTYPCSCGSAGALNVCEHFETCFAAQSLCKMIGVEFVVNTSLPASLLPETAGPRRVHRATHSGVVEDIEVAFARDAAAATGVDVSSVEVFLMASAQDTIDVDILVVPESTAKADQLVQDLTGGGSDGAPKVSVGAEATTALSQNTAVKSAGVTNVSATVETSSVVKKEVIAPTPAPTPMPTLWPTLDPTTSPTMWPTLDPTASPTRWPTLVPTASPTMWPSPLPTPVQSSKSNSNLGPTPISATGDPHMTNIHGERFDLMQPGRHMLVQVPRGAPRQTSLLLMEIDAEQIGGQCTDMYIEALNVTGQWAETRRSGGFHYHVGPGEPRAESQRFGSVDLKVAQGRTGDGVLYLNLFVKHLSSVAHPIGGLLGEDDHTAAATPSSHCKMVVDLSSGQGPIKGSVSSSATASL